jgi:glycerol-3-phosphate acyltransferase PlsX
VRIGLDAMGTNHSPCTEVEGAISSLRDSTDDLQIILIGDDELIRLELQKHDSTYPMDQLSIIHAPEKVLNEDSPAKALRQKPNSSIAIGLKMQKNGELDAFVSAGPTGAVMAGSLLILRPLKGVDRPCIGTVVPTAKGPLLLLDAGANVDCKPHHLTQFAGLGKVYAQDLMGIDTPRVGLLNIGEEPEKGNEVTLATHKILSSTHLNFVGNVEGGEILSGACDVLVCDGFVGNVILKFYESVAYFISNLFKDKLGQGSGELKDIFKILDYTETGGAPLLGVNGVVIICHGNSPPKAIYNAIGVADRAVQAAMLSHFIEEIDSFGPTGADL